MPAPITYNTIPKPARLRNKINKDYVMMLALQGKGVTEIARIVGCNHSHICRLLAPNIKQIEGYLAFKADPAALWEYQEYKVLSSVTPENINKARLAEKATFSGIARDKVRLQRGLSTSNINAITSIIQAVHDRKIQPVVVCEEPNISGDSPVTGSSILPVPSAVPIPEIEGGRGEQVVNSTLIPLYDPAVE